MSKALVLGLSALALSAGAASAQGYGYGYGYDNGYGYGAAAPLYDYAASGYGYAAPGYVAPAQGSNDHYYRDTSSGLHRAAGGVRVLRSTICRGFAATIWLRTRLLGRIRVALTSWRNAKHWHDSTLSAVVPKLLSKDEARRRISNERRMNQLGQSRSCQ